MSENCDNHQHGTMKWSMDALQNVNRKVSCYFDVQEQQPWVGGQGVCRRGKILLKNSDSSETVEELVAIKRLTYAFCTMQDAKYAYRELVLLSLVRHPNLIRLVDVFLPSGIERPMSSEKNFLAENVEKFHELFLVTKFGGETLSNQMRRKNLLKQRWPLREIASITFQVLSGLNYLHRAGIVHRDLKANNIVRNEQGAIKILDFGCGRSVQHASGADSKMTPNVMVPFYRPPEIFLGINSYDTKADIWSVGCIFAELLLGRRLFNGTDFEQQWPKFVQVLGTPDLNSCFPNGALSHVRPSYLEFAQRLAKVEAKGWDMLLPDGMFEPCDVPGLNATNARDFLALLLQFNPSQRASAEQALQHPFFAHVYCQDNAENCNNAKMDYYNFQDEQHVRSIEEWKVKILHQIERFAEQCCADRNNNENENENE